MRPPSYQEVLIGYSHTLHTTSVSILSRFISRDRMKAAESFNLVKSCVCVNCQAVLKCKGRYPNVMLT